MAPIAVLALLAERILLEREFERPSKFSFEYLLLPPRSAPTAGK